MEYLEELDIFYTKYLTERNILSMWLYLEASFFGNEIFAGIEYFS